MIHPEMQMRRRRIIGGQLEDNVRPSGGSTQGLGGAKPPKS